MMHRFDPFTDFYRPTTRHSGLAADVYRLGDPFYVEIDARHFSCVGSRAIRKAVKVQRATATNVESWLVKEVSGE